MKGELLKVLNEHRETNAAFQREVREALVAMQARREESLRSTAHGDDFEDQLFSIIQGRADKAGDIAASVGNTTGLIRNNKKGDILLELGPEHVAAGRRIVIEAKQDASYDLARARTELEQARKNREAEIGLFVFSRRTAPEGTQPLARFGHNVLCVWDAEDEASDVWLDAALSLCRALCTRAAVQRDAQEADFGAIDKAIREVEKQTEGLGDIERMTGTIRSNAEKILRKCDVMRGKLFRQVEELDEGVADLKQSLDALEAGG